MTQHVSSSPLISAADLAVELDRAAKALRVLDVRWSLAEPDGSPAHRAGHIPGAVYVDLESELSDHSVAGRGRHPLPMGTSLQDALRRWGVHDDSSIVLYDDWNLAGSSRARWVLRAAGLTDVRVLDGGLQAWKRAGLPIEEGEVIVDRGTVEVQHDNLDRGALPTLTAEQAQELGSAGRLVDARAPERYSGETEPIDPVAGHIPGARNLPFTTLLTEDGHFRHAEEIRQIVDGSVGSGSATDTFGVYCGSGVTAAVLLTALDVAGYDNAALYPGSWSEWVSSGRPAELGR